MIAKNRANTKLLTELKSSIERNLSSIDMVLIGLNKYDQTRIKLTPWNSYINGIIKTIEEIGSIFHSILATLGLGGGYYQSLPLLTKKINDLDFAMSNWQDMRATAPIRRGKDFSFDFDLFTLREDLNLLLSGILQQSLNTHLGSTSSGAELAAGRVSQKRPKIPKQQNAPVQTRVIDDRIVADLGMPKATTEEIAKLLEYLISQAAEVDRLLSRSNVDREIVKAFADVALIMSPWTSANILCLGAHLEMLDQFHLTLREELPAPTLARVSALLLNCRRIVNNTAQWNTFVKAAEDVGEAARDAGENIEAEVRNSTEVLKADPEQVDPEIPHRLGNAAKTARTTRWSKLSVGSMVRSMTNVMISATTTVVSAVEKGYEKLSPGAIRLLKVVCRLRPTMMALGRLHPRFSWVLAHDEDFKLVCAQINGAKGPTMKAPS